MKSCGLRFLHQFVAALTLASVAHAQSYHVDIGANNVFPVPSPSYLPVCSVCTTGIWNSVDAAAPGPSPLLDAGGSFAGVTISHVGGQGNFQFNSGVTAAGSDDEKLIDDLQNVGPVGSTTTWTLHGLPVGLYRVYVYSWAPDDPTHLTEITIHNGLYPPKVCGGPVVSPWTWTSGVNLAYSEVGVPAGELSVTARTVQGFGSVNGILVDPLPCASFTSMQYCTAKVNSLGCTPQFQTIGVSSAAATSGYIVRATSVINQKPGLLLYGVHGTTSIPFQGGFLCVQPPISRAIPVNSGGGPPSVPSCTGAYSLDMNAFAAGVLGGNPLPELRVPSTRVTCQWWGRDPGFAPPNGITLSRGFQYFVCP